VTPAGQVFNLSTSGNLTVATPGPAYAITYARRSSYTLVVLVTDPSGLSCTGTVLVGAGASWTLSGAGP
jgi:hypothetical protein